MFKGDGTDVVVMDDPVLKEVAERVGKSVAQVLSPTRPMPPYVRLCFFCAPELAVLFGGWQSAFFQHPLVVLALGGGPQTHPIKHEFIVVLALSM